MPTPAVNGRREHEPAHRRVAESVPDRRPEHRARGLQRVLAAVGREAEVAHEQRGDDEHEHEHARADRNGTPRFGELRDDTAEHRAESIAMPPDDLRAAEDGLEAPAVPRSRERVDEPRVDRTREEREAEAEQHRHDRPGPERRLPDPEQPVQHRRHRERDGAEQVGRAPPDRVGDDARRDLEDDHASGEERVRGERLEVGQAGVEQEERVDAPDERRGERVALDLIEATVAPAGDTVYRRMPRTRRPIAPG